MTILGYHFCFYWIGNLQLHLVSYDYNTWLSFRLPLDWKCRLCFGQDFDFFSLVIWPIYMLGDLGLFFVLLNSMLPILSTCLVVGLVLYSRQSAMTISVPLFISHNRNNTCFLKFWCYWASYAIVGFCKAWDPLSDRLIFAYKRVFTTYC